MSTPDSVLADVEQVLLQYKEKKQTDYRLMDMLLNWFHTLG